MEVVVLIMVAAVIFLFGWATGNAVETVLTIRDRRLRERDMADALQRKVKESGGE
jgi:hypothetical protein